MLDVFDRTPDVALNTRVTHMTTYSERGPSVQRDVSIKLPLATLWRWMIQRAPLDRGLRHRSGLTFHVVEIRAAQV